MSTGGKASTKKKFRSENQTVKNQKKEWWGKTYVEGKKVSTGKKNIEWGNEGRRQTKMCQEKKQEPNVHKMSREQRKKGRGRRKSEERKRKVQRREKIRV